MKFILLLFFVLSFSSCRYFQKTKASGQVKKCENLKVELDKTITILYKPPFSILTDDPDISKSLFTHAKAQDTGSKLILRIITDNCFKHFKWNNTPGCKKAIKNYSKVWLFGSKATSNLSKIISGMDKNPSAASDINSILSDLFKGHKNEEKVKTAWRNHCL